MKYRSFLLLLFALFFVCATTNAVSIIRSNCEVNEQKLICYADFFIADVEVHEGERISSASLATAYDLGVPCTVVYKRHSSTLATVRCELDTVGGLRYVHLLDSQSNVILRTPLLYTPTSTVSSRVVRTLAADGGTCVHGMELADGTCACDTFYFGATCDNACPGVTSANCPTDNCLVKGEASCDGTCVWDVMHKVCYTPGGCFSNICSQHGVCDWGASGTGQCTCDSDYYSSTCATYCNADVCLQRHGLLRLQCSSDGACMCADSDNGHYDSVDSLCQLCAKGWYGLTCNTSCNCNNHGSCDRSTAVCTCDQDALLGYWTGETCNMCSRGYYGSQCTEESSFFATLPPVSVYFGHDLDDTKGPVLFTGGSKGSTFVARGQNLTCGTIDADGKFAQSASPVVVTDDAILDLKYLSSSATLLTVKHNTVNLTVHVRTVSTTCQLKTATETNFTLATGSSSVVNAALSNTGWAVLTSDNKVLTSAASLPNSSMILSGTPSLRAQSLHVHRLSTAITVAGNCSGEWCLYAASANTGAFQVIKAVNISDAANILARATTVWKGIVKDVHTLYVLLSSNTSSDAFFVKLVGNYTSSSSSSANLINNSSANYSIASLVIIPTVGERSVPVDAADVITVEREWTPFYITLKRGSNVTLYGVAEDSTGTLYIFNEQQSQIDTSHETYDNFRFISSWNWLVLSTLMQADASNVVLHPFASFAVFSVTPSAADRAGGTPLVVHGVGFPSDARCVVNASSTAATVINSTTLQCPAPARHGDQNACDVMYLEVSTASAPIATETDNKIVFIQYNTPTIFSAQASIGAHMSILSPTNVTVFGQGFAETNTSQCLFEDATGTPVATALIFVSAEQGICEPPQAKKPTYGSTGTMRVTLDGTVFSNNISFTFVGPAAKLVVLSPKSIKVASASSIALDSPVIAVVDAEGHELGTLDEVRVVYISAAWFNSTRKDYTKAIDAMSSLLMLSYSNQTFAGETTFSLSLVYPRVGIGMLIFTSDNLESAQLVYEVEEGVPYGMEVAVQPDLNIYDEFSIPRRQPVIIFLDVSGNTVQNIMQNNTPVQNLDAFFFNGVSQESVSFDAFNSNNGQFSFKGVMPFGLFGSTYKVTFSSTGFTDVTSSDLSIMPCYGSYYAKYNTTECIVCPANAQCNGSYVINATDGYWKGGEYAYTLLRCPRIEACKNGVCRTGYAGALCATCSSGYGRSGNICGRCYKLAGNVVLVILSILLAFITVFSVMCLFFQIVGPHKSFFPAIIVCIDFIQQASIILIPLRQMPPFVEKFQLFLGVIGQCDMITLQPVSCLFGLNQHARFIIAVVAPIIVTGVVYLASLYVNVLERKSRGKQVAKQRFLKSIAPFPSAQAFYERMTQLGLDDEPTFAADRASVVDEFESQKRKILQAYYLMDKNRYALQNIGLLPSSKARDTALRIISEEQEELGQYLDHYETFVSHSDSHVGGRSRRGLRWGTGTQASYDRINRSDTIPSALDHIRNGFDDAYRHSFSLNLATLTDAPSTARSNFSDDALPYTRTKGSVEDVVNVAQTENVERFPLVTPTPFSLFAEDGPQPTPANVAIFGEGLSSEREAMTHARKQSPQIGFHFMWPSLRYQYLLLLALTSMYFFPLILTYSFKLVPCTHINYGANSTSGGIEHKSPLLKSDYSINCDTKIHRRFRSAGIVIGTLYGAFVPFTVGYMLFVNSGKVGMYMAFALNAVFGTRNRYCWWCIASFVKKFVFVILTLFVKQSLAALIVMWILLAYVPIVHWTLPYANSRICHAEQLSLVLLIIIDALQLIPLFQNGEGNSLTRTGTACGVIIMVVACGGIITFIYTSLINVKPFGDGFLHRLQKYIPGLSSSDYTALPNGKNSGSTRSATAAKPGGMTDRKTHFTFETYNISLMQKILEENMEANESNAKWSSNNINEKAEKDFQNKKALLNTAGIFNGALGGAGNEKFYFQYMDDGNYEPVEAYETDDLMEDEVPTALHLMKKELSLEQGLLFFRIEKLEKLIQRFNLSKEREEDEE